jgi:alginate O-acetyltransferase complex protein AlgI
MQFNSLAFLLFVGLLFLGWPLVKRQAHLRWGYLVVASYVFYGWADWRALAVLAVVSAATFGAALSIAASSRRRRPILLATVAAIVGMLALLRYHTFAAENISALLPSLSARVRALDQGLGVALPSSLGVSFYTFQAISYLLDVYHGRLEPVATCSTSRRTCRFFPS